MTDEDRIVRANDRVQTITLVTADGRRLTYSGPEQFDPESPPQVVGLEVRPSRPLREGCRWEDCDYGD